MSDLEKAEELLRKVERHLGKLREDAIITVSEEIIYREIETYFWKKCSITSHDAGGNVVKFSIDPDGDVAIEWSNLDMPDVYFEPGILLDALRELGVAE